MLGSIGLVAFLLMLVHAAAWLREEPVQHRSSIFLSRAHAKRRVASSALILFAILWLTAGTTFLRTTVFSRESPVGAMVFLAVLGGVVIAVLLLAYVDIREARTVYRSRSGKRPNRRPAEDGLSKQDRDVKKDRLRGD